MTTKRILYTSKRRTTGLSPTVTIYDANDVIVVNAASMTELANGDYYYDYTPTVTGWFIWYANASTDTNNFYYSPMSGAFYNDSTATSDTNFVSTLQLARYLNMEGKLPDPTLKGESRSRETIGTGDGTTTDFWFDNAGIISDTYSITYGSTEASAQALTETTHYTVDKDLGKLTLTGAGATLVSTNNIYAAYSYVKTSHGFNLTDTQLDEALDRAQKEFEDLTMNHFADGTASTPNYTQVTSEKHTGKGRFDRDYFLRNFPIPDVSCLLNGDLTATGTTIPVDSTDGFLSTGTISIETEKISYTSKSSTAFIGATRGVDDSTGAAHSSAEPCYPYVVELSTTSPGGAITWTVLDRDTDYDIQLETGKVHVYRDDIILDEISATTYPPNLVPNRFRATYLWGNEIIPDDVKRAVLMIAAKDLIHTMSRKALIDGIAPKDKVNTDIDEEWINQTIEKYRNIKLSNI